MLQVITHASLTVDEIVQWYEPDALQRYGLAATAMILDGCDRDMATHVGALAGQAEEETAAGVDARPRETASPGYSSSASEAVIPAPIPSPLASRISEPDGTLTSALKTGSCRMAAQVRVPYVNAVLACRSDPRVGFPPMFRMMTRTSVGSCRPGIRMWLNHSSPLAL